MDRASPYSGALFADLRHNAIGPWHDYTRHAFVRGIADGTLPDAAFKCYLVQDYLFLVHFARAYALAAYKATDLAHIRHATEGLKAIVDTEMQLHVDFSKRWGLTEADLQSAPELPGCLAYTRYVLEIGHAGDLLDLHVALAPCMVGYGEIGLALANDPDTKLDGNPYADWITMYASEEYQSVARAECAVLDDLFEQRAGPGRMPELHRIFDAATRLEVQFWQMGLDAAQ